MLSGTLNPDHRVVFLFTHMAGSPERKWTTLRKIAPPQGKIPAEEAPSPDPAATGGPLSPATAGDPEDPASILVVHPAAPTTRLIRETFESFTDARVITTADPLRAFELALQRRYGLFFFAMQVGQLSGPMLYEFIAKACAAGRGPRLLPPGVVFIREKDDPKLPDALARDVRVKDVLSKPIRIARLLESVRGVLEVKDPTVRG
jgi:CheY-like chemotaxis protein